VKSLLEQGVDINSLNAAYRTQLDRAVTLGHLDIVRLLIERGVEVDSRDEWGWAALHVASRYGHLGSCRYSSITEQTLTQGRRIVELRYISQWPWEALGSLNCYLNVAQTFKH
jgi:Ankyrin repeats (many copies)